MTYVCTIIGTHSTKEFTFDADSDSIAMQLGKDNKNDKNFVTIHKLEGNNKELISDLA